MSFISECSHRSPQVPNSPLGREIQPLGRDMPFCVVLIEFKLYIESFMDNGPHLVAPLAGVLDEIPFARSAPLRSRGMEFVFMFSGCSLNTVFVFNSAPLINHAFVGWIVLYPSMFSRMLQPAQSVVPMLNKIPALPFQISCLCHE